MLLEYGNIKVDASWKVNEVSAIGYSRAYYVYDGDVTYSDEYAYKRLKKGFLYIFPSHSPYTMVCDEGNLLDCTYMHIEWDNAIIRNIIEIPCENFSFLYHLINSIRIAIDNENKKILSSLIDCLILFCQENSFINQPKGHIAQIITYISEHLGHDLTLSQLSNIIGYNPQYFIRQFKDAVGISPHQYIINCRLKEATKLLKANETVSNISELVGYSNVKTFSRGFKNQYGVSPSNFRKYYTIVP